MVPARGIVGATSVAIPAAPGAMPGFPGHWIGLSRLKPLLQSGDRRGAGSRHCRSDFSRDPRSAGRDAGFSRTLDWSIAAQAAPTIRGSPWCRLAACRSDFSRDPRSAGRDAGFSRTLDWSIAAQAAPTIRRSPWCRLPHRRSDFSRDPPTPAHAAGRRNSWGSAPCPANRRHRRARDSPGCNAGPGSPGAPGRTAP